MGLQEAQRPVGAERRRQPRIARADAGAARVAEPRRQRVHAAAGDEAAAGFGVPPQRVGGFALLRRDRRDREVIAAGSERLDRVDCLVRDAAMSQQLRDLQLEHVQSKRPAALCRPFVDQ
ncbi:hypothetical protein [Paenibacillus koleovorans]|uniref:hypothetical protein n=1 Tax=Paenibacillus koleovorans TaxID=121608 RepID=UPI000FDA0374|nr:hypothetical protein [Paenibacillus koleovorans]